MKWDDLIFLPFVGFIQWPLVFIRRKKLIGITALLWLAYAIYESLMKAQLFRRRRDGAA